MSFDIKTLVTDRTQADVTHVEEIAEKIRSGTVSESELAEFNSCAMKGAYNYTDLNRVGYAMLYLAERLNSFGYMVSVSPKVDWVETDSPSLSDMDVYLTDLAELRAAFAVMRSTPAVPSDMVRLTFKEANNIEKILEDIDLLLTRASQAWFYSGELFSGEV